MSEVEFNLERSELVGVLYDRLRGGLELDVATQKRAHDLGIDIERIENVVSAEFGAEE